MNVYDFDKTICRDDSETDFFYYELRHHPINWFRIPYFLIVYLRFRFNKISREEYRNGIYLILKNLKDVNKEVEKFWEGRKKKILSWYKLAQKEDDVIVSATPKFLLEPILNEMHIKNYILSEFDVNTRKCVGLLNYGNEKLRRFKLRYNVEDIDEFYTDSLSDTPMLRVAKRPFIVRNYVPQEYK